MASSMTLSARVIVVQATLAIAVAAVGIVGRAQVSGIEQQLQVVETRRLPALDRLNGVADVYAVDVVDAVHKVSDGTLLPDQGVVNLVRAGAQVRLNLEERDRLMAGIPDSRRSRTLDSLLSLAESMREEAMSLMETGDVARLRDWRVDQLYRRVDPLTEAIRNVLRNEQRLADSTLRSLQSAMRASSNRALAGLSVAAILALMAGAFLASGVLRGAARIRDVLHRASEGDRTARIGAAPAQQLADVAEDVDQMLDAVSRAEESLHAQASELARSEAEARSAVASKSAFLGSVSHELRTPLNVILGYADLLREDASLTSDQRLGVRRIGEAGTYLLELIDDVLGVARLDAGALRLQESPYDPMGLLADVERLLEHRARSKGLVFSVTAHGEVPTSVIGDGRRLQQVLVNLAGNAIKFTAEGSVRIEMRWEDEHLHFLVADTGPGISREDQAHIFQSFGQGESGRASGEGVGLGLFISRDLVMRMGGELHLDSRPGAGARFSFHVTAPAASEAPPTGRPRARRLLAPGQDVPPMLVVDDRLTNREVLASVLRRSGFEADLAVGGAEALEMLQRKPYSMAWLDLRMPGMDGFEAIRRIRNHETGAARRLPVVAITASVIDLDADGARALGFDDLIPKPFRADQVLDTIERLLRVRLVEGQVKETPSSSGIIFDVSQLEAGQRATLVNLLVSGDVQAASRFAADLGPWAAPLKSEIDRYQTDALLNRLRAVPAAAGVDHA